MLRGTSLVPGWVRFKLVFPNALRPWLRLRRLRQSNMGRLNRHAECPNLDNTAS